MNAETVFEAHAQQQLNLLTNQGFEVVVLVSKSGDSPHSKKPVQFMSVEDLPLSIEQLQSPRGRYGASPRAVEDEAFPKLTQRERDVLALIANGYTRYEVAEVLSITHNTAAKYIKNTYMKLKVSNVAEATQKAILMGIIEI